MKTKMSKFMIVLSMIMVIGLICLTGCGDEVTYDEAITKSVSDYGFVKIDGDAYDNLYYAKDTKVIYIVFSFPYYHDTYYGEGYGYMSPYISENGKYCRYIDDEFVEIE
jgi:hypothetical protein